MPIIIVKNKEVLDLNSLHIAVLRFVWEKEKMTASEVDQMQHSIVRYKEHCDLTGNPDILFVIQSLAKILQQAEEGKFEARKAVYKEHGIDWKKVYRLPGAHNIRDLMRARQEYERYKRTHLDTEQIRKPN